LWVADPVLAQAETPSGPIYVVQRGDTLTSIAQMFGVSLDDLIRVNQLQNPNYLAVGDRLIIPGLEGIQGVLVAAEMPLGETLESLSWRYQTSEENLRRLNHLVSPGQLYAGARLIVPQTEEAPEGKWISLGYGQTSLELAILEGVNPWELKMLDGDGAAIRIPGELVLLSGENGEGPGGLPRPFSQLDIQPLPLVQGKTTVVRLAGANIAAIEGTLAGWELHFFPDGEGNTVALQGIPAMMESGVYSLTLQGKLADGTPFRFQQLLPVVSKDYGRDPPLNVNPRLIDPILTQSESEGVFKIVSNVTLQKMWRGVFTPPSPYADCINSPFGRRRTYNGDMYDSYHSGVDFCGGTGIPIYAPAPGRVVFAGQLEVRGNATIIDHGWGVFTGYWHQSEIDVQVGNLVEVGQVIGLVGGSGRVSGPHLHWELWVNGIPVDPLEWLVNEYP
jgi:murein DD-endopeptidase MepM/ murein hydrolase activator NlpD